MIEEEHDEGYYLNDERRALLYEARDKQMKLNMNLEPAAARGTTSASASIGPVADHENGMLYCPLCRELWEEGHKCKSESAK